MENKFYILGAGDHANVVADTYTNDLEGFIDIFNKKEFLPSSILGSRILGDLEWFNCELETLTLKPNAIVAFGNNIIRNEVYEKFKNRVQFINVKHKLSYLSKDAKIGKGNYFGVFSVVNTLATIGDNNIINSGAIIEHHCVLGSNINVAPGAKLSGNVTICDGVFIGIGATILEGVTVGKNVIIGAGSNVIRDVPEGVTLVGNPGRKI